VRKGCRKDVLMAEGKTGCGTECGKGVERVQKGCRKSCSWFVVLGVKIKNNDAQKSRIVPARLGTRLE
jgi:hypothetical protein